MKKPTPLIVIVSFMITMIFSSITSIVKATAINVTTSINAASNPINICTDVVTLTMVVSNTSGSAATSGYIEQTLPTGCTINITSPACPFMTVVPNNNVITYNFTGIPNGYDCSVIATLTIPCSVTPTNNQLSITYTSSGNYTLNLSPTPPFVFQVTIPVMNVVDFFDDQGLPIAQNTAWDMLISPNHWRIFDFLVSDGIVHSLDFTYTYEQEITPTGFVLEGVASNGVPTGMTLALAAPGANPQTYPITTAMISQLFPGSPTQMTLNQRIRVKELFDVTFCTPGANDASSFKIEWSCPAIGQTCNWDLANRSISVLTSNSGISCGYDFTDPLDICGADPSDMIITINNGTHDVQRIPGSAMKTLHQIVIPMNQDGLTFSDIFLETAGGGASLNVMTQLPLGFYTYVGAPTYTVTLDFDLLTAQLPGFAAVLTSGFIPETPTELYNEIVESGVLWLRFAGTIFNCHTATFYPATGYPNGYHFDDCPKPQGGYMFFGYNNGGLANFHFFYDNMCGTNPHPANQIFANLANSFPVTGFAEADQTDLVTTEHAHIDFTYQYAGTSGAPSPFVFGGAYSGNPYFVCATTTYQATLTIPNLYALNTATVTYYPDPNNSAITQAVTVSGPTPSGSDNLYIVSGIGFNGRINIDVQLVNCPVNTGGFDTFSSSIQAVCGTCNTCPYTISCFNTQLFHHCQGYCGNPGGTPPQATNRPFLFNRTTLGWDDETMSNFVTPGPNIKLNRAYNCDVIEVTSTGSISNNPLASSLAYLIKYENYAPSTFQYFEFIDGHVDYTTTAGPQSYPISAADLGSALNGSTGWPITCTTCSLFVNINTALNDINANGGGASALSFHMNVRVKPMATTPAAGFYNLPQVRGQFFSNYGISCDDWGDNMNVLNVRTSKSFAIRNAADGDESLGWPWQTGVCERHFLFSTSVSGGLPSLDDFPNEFRPIVRWPLIGNPITMTLPAQVHFNNAMFVVRNNANWPAWVNVNATAGANITLDSWDNLGTATAWPLLDKNGQGLNMFIRGSLTNDCPATVNNPIGNTDLSFHFISKFYSPDVDCQITNPAPENPPLTYPGIAAVSTPTLVLANTGTLPVHVYSNITTLVGFTLTVHAWNRWSSMENVWIRPTSPGITFTAVHRDGGLPISVSPGGYFKLGTIFDEASSFADLTFDITLTSCNPGVLIPVSMEYGYSCMGYPNIYPPVNNAPCLSNTFTFDVFPEPSGMSMAVTTPTVSTGSPCNQYTYTVRILSTQLADLENPTLMITLPSGLTFTSATYQTSAPVTSGALIIPSPIGNDYTFDVDDPAYTNNGIPPTPHYIDLFFTVTGTCAMSGTNPTLVFHPLSKNICGGDVTFPDYTHQLHFTQQPNPSAIASASINPVTSCTNPLQFHVDLSSIVGTGVISATIHSTYNAAFTFVSSNYPVQSTPPGTTDWVINGLGSSLNVTANLNIPANFCGSFPLTVVIDLVDVACCSTTVQYTVNASQYICCNPCADTMHLSAQTRVDTCRGGGTGSILLSVTGGTSPYTYLWSNGAITQNIFNLVSGPYTVTVTDNLGCTATQTFFVNFLSSISISINASSTSICSGDPVTLTATGCPTCIGYIWNPGAVPGISVNFTPAATTVYTVTGHDSYGCTANASVQVDVRDCKDDHFCMHVLRSDLYEQGNQVITTADDGYALVGSMHESDEDDDLYLLKYKADFTMDFNNRFGDALNDDGTPIIFDEMAYSVARGCDYYYVTGSGRIKDGDYDIIVACFNNSGNMIWCNRYGEKGDDFGMKIISSPTVGCDMLYITGYTNSYGNTSADYDMFILQLEPNNGSIMDFRIYGNKDIPEKAYDIIKLNDNSGYVITGDMYNGSWDILTVQVDNSLALTNNTIVGESKNDYASALVQVEDNIYVVGKSNSFTAVGDYNVYLLRLKAGSLALQDAVYYGTPMNEAGLSIDITNDKNLLISGSIYSNDHSGVYNALLMKVKAPNLALDWSTNSTLDNNFDYYISAVDQVNDEITAIGIFGVSASDREIFISRMDYKGLNCCMKPIILEGGKGGKEGHKCSSGKPNIKDTKHGIEKTYYNSKYICNEANTRAAGNLSPIIIKSASSDDLLPEINIYPNPNQGAFDLKINDDSREIKTIEVMDITGRKLTVDEMVLDKNLASVKFTNATNGMYYIIVSDYSNAKWKIKVIVSK